jgi:hypothetical protein
MFSNSCLGVLKYESTATSIAMAGAFLSFIIDYTGNRLAYARNHKSGGFVVDTDRNHQIWNSEITQLPHTGLQTTPDTFFTILGPQIYHGATR